VRSSVSIALFFLLSGFFLFALLAALEHSRKALAVALVCLAAVVCIIVFLTPVQLPTWLPGIQEGELTTTTTTAAATTATTAGPSPARAVSTTVSTGGGP
jgi:hypothetical protein